jgi:hypothetical protein
MHLLDHLISNTVLVSIKHSWEVMHNILQLTDSLLVPFLFISLHVLTDKGPSRIPI